MGEVEQGVARLRGAFVAVVQAADLWMATTRPAVSSATGRGRGASLSSPRCVRVRELVGDEHVQNAPKAGSR